MRIDPASGKIDDFHAPQTIQLRELHAEDSIEQITEMLHRAFARLGEMGVSCSCASQTAEVTRKRISRGSCYVALQGERIVGTVTVYETDLASESAHYRDAQVASVRQLGVDPDFQGKGIGSALLQVARSWARRHGYSWLALDTPEPACHLIQYYSALGFKMAETLQFSGRPYRSVLFAQSVIENSTVEGRSCFARASFRTRASPSFWIRHVHRHTNTMRPTIRYASERGRVIGRRPWPECERLLC